MSQAQFTIPLITVIPGQLITASLWNNEWNNVGTNLNPSGVGGYSDTDTQMQIQTAPYPGSVTSHASSIAGELERIRYQLSAILGPTTPAFWYAAPPTNLTNVASQLIPIGGVIDYPSATPPGSNFLLANGQAIGRVAYSALFSLIGTTFGAGDASTTFNIPNYTDLMSITAGNLYSLGATGGAVSNTPTLTDPGHNHTQNSHTHTDSGHTHSVPVENITLDDDGGSHAVFPSLPSSNPVGKGSSSLMDTPGTGSISQAFLKYTGKTAGATSGSSAANISTVTPTNNSNTTGITISNIPTLSPYLGMYKLIRVL